MTPSDLKKWRSEYGFSQAQLAKRLNVAVMTVSRWETGNRTIPSLLSLALKTIECEQKTEKEKDHGKYIFKG